MLQILKSENGTLRELDPASFEKGSWINLMDPSSDDLPGKEARGPAA
jgi:hypothetical protein